MGYGIIRVQKVKAPAVGSMQYHNDRVPGQHSNEDIDQEKSNLNKEYIEHGSYRAEVNERIERFRESSRKIRKDAVVLAEGVATASPEFFDGKSREEVMAYFDDVFEFCKSEFGEQNLVHFTVHMDETTPHAHFGFTPIKDGTLRGRTTSTAGTRCVVSKTATGSAWASNGAWSAVRLGAVEPTRPRRK